MATNPSPPPAFMKVMGSQYLKQIPWAMIAPHEKQAQANHSQSLRRLNERGGLCPSEILDILAGRRYGSAKVCPENDRYLAGLVQRWVESNKAPKSSCGSSISVGHGESYACGKDSPAGIYQCLPCQAKDVLRSLEFLPSSERVGPLTKFVQQVAGVEQKI